MDTSSYNHMNILDLPNEMLLTISNKLNMIDVLYSLVDVNERFDRLVLDPLYIHHLDMTIKPWLGCVFSINKQVLDRICEKVLPRIYHQVNQVSVEPHSIQRILHTINYPQLYSLSLVHFPEDILFQYLSGDSILHNLLTEQITHLNIDIRNETTIQWSKTLSSIFELILSSCKRLINLNFGPLINQYLSLHIFTLPATSCISSTLTKLTVCVTTFDDCLYLLNGRLDCLSTLIISVESIQYTLSHIDNTKKLPKLKCFSLISLTDTYDYDNQIIPLLRRMINLEELTLFLVVNRNDSTYIDGIQLHDEILIYMPRLYKFTFSIRTHVFNTCFEIDLPSNDDIQRSFIKRKFAKVGSYVHSLPLKVLSECHVYSLPYQFEGFFYLNNSFPGGMFHKVRYMVMKDSRPFEHKLFKLISQDFPFLNNLFVINDQPQNDQQQSFSLILFPHLENLMLQASHVDYAEQFLDDKKTHLPRLQTLSIKYESLAMVTNNFTNDKTRLNCAKVKILYLEEPFVRPENFHQYFPLL